MDCVVSTGSTKAARRRKQVKWACGSMRNSQRRMSTVDGRLFNCYVAMVHGGPVSWATKKQEIITLSTTKSEYVGLTHVRQEQCGHGGSWSRSLDRQQPGPITIWEDNEGAKLLAVNQSAHWRKKHFGFRYHWIRDEI